LIDRRSLFRALSKLGVAGLLAGTAWPIVIVPLVYNGTPVFRAAPWACAINFNRAQDFCSAVVAADGWVLTAAHCPVEVGAPVALSAVERAKESEPDRVRVGKRLNLGFLASSGTVTDRHVPFEASNQYQTYDPMPDCDVALLRIDAKGMTWPSPPTRAKAPTNVTVFGWGSARPRWWHRPWPWLLKGDLTADDKPDECFPDGLGSVNGDYVLCAHSLGQLPSPGDSGGPLMDGDKLVAISSVSWHADQAVYDEAAQFVRVIGFQDWISCVTEPGKTRGMRIKCLASHPPQCSKPS
jgi:hypothetical protein